MKIYFNKIFQLDDQFQENLIDNNSFKTANYLVISKNKEVINGMVHEDIYTLNPLSFFAVKLREDTQTDLLNQFNINPRLLEAGLILAGIDKDFYTIYLYNCTNNNIYIKANTVIGEIK